jgi:lysophospholipase L1-like esterase
VLALAVLLLASACSSGEPTSSPTGPSPTGTSSGPSPDATDPASGGADYVALGDSYTAGPGIAPPDTEQPTCFRSDGNWPHLLAGTDDLSLTDVSCSGATTQSAIDGVGSTVPSQLDALSRATELVTVGIGGNDGGLFGTLLQSCSRDADACGRYVAQQAPDILATTTASVTDLLGQVRDRAPEARILLVGYLRLAPESGTCDLLGVPSAAADDARRIEQGLEDALVEAAANADVTFVSMRTASQGHDVCAGRDAWVNGRQVSDGDGIVFHPRTPGMQAVASAVAAAR